jgi:hypothetical protein
MNPNDFGYITRVTYDADVCGSQVDMNSEASCGNEDDMKLTWDQWTGGSLDDQGDSHWGTQRYGYDIGPRSSWCKWVDPTQ